MHGVAKASGVRRCLRRSLGTVSARDLSNSGHSFSLKFLCAQLHWGKPGMIALRNVMLVQMWCRHTCGVQSGIGRSKVSWLFAM